MNKNHYETVIIINAALEDDQIQTVISLVKDTIINSDSEITAIDDWGRKRLAYPIQKSKSGYYVIFRFISSTGLIKKLERLFQINESIIRYLTVKLTKKDLENIKNLSEKRAQESELVESNNLEVTNSESPTNERNELTTN